MGSNMDRGNDPAEPRRQPPVTRYAAIIGAIVVIGIVLAVLVGQRSENPRPAGVASSPSAGASTGPSPRY